MKIQVQITEKELRQMVLEKIQRDLGEAGARLTEKDVEIETKSTQNYRSEWERAAFRARVEVDR